MLKRMRTALNGNQGFTMIELLVVLGVLGILAAVAVPKFSNMTNKADMVKAKTELKTIQTGMEMYYAENNTYPPTGDSTDFSTALASYVDLDSIDENYNLSLDSSDDENYTVTAEYYKEGKSTSGADVDYTFTINHNSITESSE